MRWGWRQSLDPGLRARYDRSSNLRRLYGLTLDQDDALVAQQGGVCAICGEPPVKGRGKRLPRQGIFATRSRLI